MAIINQPPVTQVDDVSPNGQTSVNNEWRNFFVAVYNICNAVTMSGTTAHRPTTLLWVGRTYFDTTLGIPIWLKSVGPTVWVNSAGAPV